MSEARLSRISLHTPVGKSVAQGRTVYHYHCGTCKNTVKVYASQFRGVKPEPGKGSILCPHCKFQTDAEAWADGPKEH